MRVLFVHQHLGDQGGAEANILRTASELEQRGYAPGLLYRSGTGIGEARWQITFPECFRLPKKDAGAATSQVLDEFAPDLVWIHNMPDPRVIETLVRWPAPTIRTVHDHSLYCMRTYKYNYFTRKICSRPASACCLVPCLASVGRNRTGRFPLTWVSYRAKRREIQLNRRCSRIVVFSQYMKRELVGNGFDPEKIEVHVPLLPRNNLAAAETGQERPARERPLVLWAGQMIRGKGLDVFLRSLNKVRTDFDCVVLGDGNQRPHCERLCQRLGLHERVKFLGFVPSHQMQAFYRQAALFAFTSLWPEPFGMAGPEAMRHGLPVVAFEAGGVGEWLRDRENGYLVPWMNTDLFAARLEELLRNQDLARAMGRRAMERANCLFDSERALQRIEMLLTDVTGSSLLNRAPGEVCSAGFSFKGLKPELQTATSEKVLSYE